MLKLKSLAAGRNFSRMWVRANHLVCLCLKDFIAAQEHGKEFIKGLVTHNEYSIKTLI